MKKNIPLRIGIMCNVLLLCVSGCGGSRPSQSCNNTQCVLTNKPENSIKSAMDQDLLEAVINNHIANVKKLLCDGADANAKTNYGYTALYIACRDGYSEIAELLLTHGADPNAKNDFREQALPMAVSRDYKDIATLLLRYGADVNAQVENGATVLFFANTQEMKDLLLAHGANLNIEDDQGRLASCAALCWREGE